ncbi:MFS transporter [Candidatus Poribacteria bacterium]|nr:MFS transporter [Candidatus Poribacteria bacterium]MYB01437.1 MFS transporter [Candidatus Poribacteria bacterium]
MLFRFSLYGFLKNQRYYENFLYLAFLDKGLSYFAIGILIGFREVCTNLFEIPSGAVADLYGRRRAMIFSFFAYIASFVIFAVSKSLLPLFAAMFFYGLGDAFRSGTHKAMIFDWLRLQGRSDEKTKIYGFTRSWSQMGSAVSVLIAGALVFYSGNFVDIFWFSIIPYAMNIVNFFGYPARLDGDRQSEFSLKAVARMLGSALKQSGQFPPLRRLVFEGMGFEGMYKASKDYLQPILKQTVIALPLLLALDESKRTALLVAGVYFLLYFLSSFASRNSHKVSNWRGGDEGAARFMWWIDLAFFALLIPVLWFNWYPAIITLFIGLAILQNFWRPGLISRFNAQSTPETSATILSIEAQSKSLATIILAPLLGLLVDTVGNFSPVGIVGACIAVAILIAYRGELEERPVSVSA